MDIPKGRGEEGRVDGRAWIRHDRDHSWRKRRTRASIRSRMDRPGILEDVQDDTRDEENARAANEELAEAFWTCRNDDRIRLEALLERRKDLVHRFDYDRRTLLHLAAAEGKAEIVDMLLRRGADPNARDAWNRTPVEDAYRASHVETLCMLQKVGNTQDRVLTAQEVPDRMELDQEGKQIHLKDLEVEDTVHGGCRIGAGSMAVVHVAFWRGRQVALKRISPQKLTPETQEQFNVEIAVLSRLAHPNIVQFYGVCREILPAATVIEYCEGGSLLERFQRIRDGVDDRLSIRNAHEIAIGIARGMEYLHNHRPVSLIHRNLKPENILFTGHGVVKIADFGFCRLTMNFDMENESTPRGAAIARTETFHSGSDGVTLYTAPELVQNRGYGKPVDVFAFAMILYELVEGKDPHESLDKTEKVAEGGRPVPSSARWEDPLKDLLAECWAHKHEERPSFSNIRKRLETVLESLPTRDSLPVASGCLSKGSCNIS